MCSEHQQVAAHLHTAVGTGPEHECSVEAALHDEAFVTVAFLELAMNAGHHAIGVRPHVEAPQLLVCEIVTDGGEIVPDVSDGARADVKAVYDGGVVRDACQVA